ncbi:MAG TPA: serine hydrolase [Burkholderiaceae bacterium]
MTSIRTAALIAALPFALLAGTAHAETATPSAALTQQLRQIVDDPAIPLASLSVVAIRGGKVVYRRQFGDKRIASGELPALPADRNTMYRIASVSKMVTAMGVLKLVEQGKLALDTDVGAYLGYSLRNPHFPDQAITLRMLMSHTASLRDDAGYSWDGKVMLKDVLVPGGTMYGTGAMWAKNAAPGAYFSYCNLNWGIIGTIMERVTGERFDRLMRRLIFAPMGLHAGFNPVDFSAAEVQDLATLYRKRTTDDKEIWNSKGPWIAQTDDYSVQPPKLRPGALEYVPGNNGTLFGPQGSLRASADDLARLMRMLMHRGMHGKLQILKSESVDLMLTRQWTHDPKANNGDTYRGLFNAWGLGMQHFQDISAPGQNGVPAGDRLVDSGGLRAVGHLGDAWGLKSAFVIDPITRNGMIYLIGGPGADPEENRGKYSSHYRFEEQVLSALYRHMLAPPPAPQNAPK